MSYLNQNNFVKAVRFVHENIDQPITLENIAKATSISVSSLKRLFLEATNVSVGAFVRHLRMERAFRSLKNKEMSVLEVALSSGFEDHSAFARAFKENFGYSPTYARQKVNIVDELDCVSLEEPEIIEIDEIRVQLITKKGTYFEAALLAWQSLKTHLTSAELDDDFMGSFIGIGHDNPHDGDVKEDRVRFSAGITLCSRDLTIEHRTIAKGMYAKFNYIGKPNNLGLAYHYIYGPWSTKQSQYVINAHIPAFMVFDAFPEGLKEQGVAIYVPVQNKQA